MKSTDKKSISPAVAIGVIVVLVVVVILVFLHAANVANAPVERITIPPDVAAHLHGEATNNTPKTPVAQQAADHH